MGRMAMIAVMKQPLLHRLHTSVCECANYTTSLATLTGRRMIEATYSAMRMNMCFCQAINQATSCGALRNCNSSCAADVANQHSNCNSRSLFFRCWLTAQQHANTVPHTAPEESSVHRQTLACKPWPAMIT
jgi:hypothetical protein